MYDKLIGKIVKNVFVDKNYQSDVVIETDDGFYNLLLYSECCSESYVSDVLSMNMGKIISIEELCLDDKLKEDDKNIKSVLILKEFLREKKLL